MLLGLMRALLRRRTTVIVAAALLTALAGLGALRLEVSHSVEMWLLEDDADLAAHRDLVRRFGHDDALLVALSSEDALGRRSLAALARLAARFESLPRVRRVIGLAEAVGADESGHFDRAAIETRFADRPGLDPFAPLRGALLDPDDKTGALMIELDPASGDTHAGLVATVRAACDREARALGGSCFVAGAPVIDDAFVSLSRRDLFVLGPLVALITLLVLTLMLRNPWGVAAIVASVATSVVWTLGVAWLLEIRLHLLTLAAPPLLLAIGVAQAVHLLTERRAELARAEPSCVTDASEPVARAAAAVWVPCLFTTLTTACGYASLLWSRLGPVRDLGVVCLVGAAAALIATFTLLPALLVVLPVPSPQAPTLASKLGAPLASIAAWAVARPRSILLGLAVLVVLATLSASRLRVRASDVDNFPPSTRAMTDALAVDRALGGALALDVLVEGPPGAAADPAVLRRVDRIERVLARLPGVGSVESPTGTLRFMQAALVGGMPRLPQSIEETRALVDDAELLVPGLDRLVARDRSALRLRARFSYAAFGDLAVDDLRREISSAAGPGLVARPTGLVVLLRNVEGYLLSSQIQSALLALVLVTLAMAALLRSGRLALVAMIPNVAPLVGVLGVMGALDVPLDVATTLIVSIGLGIAVDDTIHLLERWRRLVRAGEPTGLATIAAVRAVGPAVGTTTVVLVSGCLVLLFASFRPDVRFGWLTALVVVLAFACDVLVTPAVLALVRSKLHVRAHHEPGIRAEQRERVVGGE